MVRYHLLWQIVCLVSLLRIVQCLNTPSTKVISRKLPLRSNMQPIPSTELRSGVVLSSVPRIEADRKIILSVMLSASYLSVIVSVMTLPVALAAKDFFPSGGSFLSNVVSIGTIATMVGKFLLGPPTDYFGGDRTLRATMIATAALLYGCSVSKRVEMFGVLWVIYQFTYASAWGAVGKIVRENYPESEWGTQLGNVAASSRLGSMGSSILYGRVLQGNSIIAAAGAATTAAATTVTVAAGGAERWRLVFLCGAAIQTAIVALYTFLSGKIGLDAQYSRTNRTNAGGKAKEDAPVTVPGASVPGTSTIETVPQVLSRVSRDPMFWLMLTGKVCLMAVGQFISFIPRYLATGHKMNANMAASNSAFFALGSLATSVLGTRVYQKLSKNKQIAAVTVCNILGFFLPATLVAHHWQGASLELSKHALRVILAAWGAVWALPFYVPPGLLALALGGVHHAALLTNLFDAAGFLAAALVSYFAMELGKTANWIPLLGALAAGGGIAAFTMAGAMRLAMVRDSRRREQI